MSALTFAARRSSPRRIVQPGNVGAVRRGPWTMPPVPSFSLLSPWIPWVPGAPLQVEEKELCIVTLQAPGPPDFFDDERPQKSVTVGLFCDGAWQGTFGQPIAVVAYMPFPDPWEPL